MKESAGMSRKLARLLSWLIMLFLVLIVIPIGMVMLVVSGVWSAADRVLLKINR